MRERVGKTEEMIKLQKELKSIAPRFSLFKTLGN
jgi:hypothetical protein